MSKQLSQQLNEVQGKLDESNRTLNDFDSAKKKLSIENSDLLRQLEDAESQVSQLQKLKISLTTQLEDTKRMADEEGRERAVLLGKFRNLEHDIDGIREQLEEEAEAKADLQRQLSKANAESQMWRQKYETEGVARAEELEESKYVIRGAVSCSSHLLIRCIMNVKQEETPGSLGRSRGGHRVAQPEDGRSREDQAAPVRRARGHAGGG